MKILSFFFSLALIGSLYSCTQVDHGDLFPMKRGDKWGYINTSGKWAIPPKYQYAFPFSEDRALFQQNNQWGVIDKNAKEIIPATYQLSTTINLTPNYDNHELRTDYFSEGVILLSKDYQVYNLLSKDGDLITTFPNYHKLRPVSSGWMAFQSHSQAGYMDTTGTVVLELPPYRHIGDFHDNRALFQPTFFSKMGFINQKGEVVIDTVFQSVNSFSEGLAAAQKDDFLYGFIDKAGNWVIEPQYQYADRFSEGLAQVRGEEGIYYIDKNGNVVISSPIEGQEICQATSFHNGLALVKLTPKNSPCSIPIEGFSMGFNNTLYAYIDTTGKVIYQESLAELRQRQANIKAERIAKTSAYKAEEKAEKERMMKAIEDCPVYQAFGDTSAHNYAEFNQSGHISRFYFPTVVIIANNSETFDVQFPVIISSDQASFIQIPPISIKYASIGEFNSPRQGPSQKGFECALLAERVFSFYEDSRGEIDSLSVNLPDQPGQDYWKGQITFASRDSGCSLLFHINSTTLSQYSARDTSLGWVKDRSESSKKVPITHLRAKYDRGQLVVDTEAGSRYGSQSATFSLRNFTGDGSYFHKGLLKVEGFETGVMKIRHYLIPVIPENNDYLSDDKEMDAEDIVVRKKDQEGLLIISTDHILRPILVDQ